jgi:hypothetical protein
MNLSKYQENEWLQFFRAKNTYVGLVSDSATVAELEGNTPFAHEITGYSGGVRKSIEFGAITKSGTDPSEMSGPLVTILFDSMPLPAGRLIKYLIICDANSGGNLLAWSEVTTGIKSWNSGDTARVQVNSVKVKLN